MRCPLCNELDHVTESVEVQAFPYVDDYVDDLQAAVPVMRCSSCSFEWTDERGEAARAAAVAIYLKTKARRGL